MKPLSPILLLTAAYAAASRLRARHAGGDCALGFVSLMGRVSHTDGTYDSTSWPLGEPTSIEQLVQTAREAEMLRSDAAAGDLVVFHRPHLPSVAIVVGVLDVGIGPIGRTTKCRLMFARATQSGRVAVVCRDVWCRTTEGDQFIRWYEGRRDAITRRAA